MTEMSHPITEMYHMADLTDMFNMHLIIYVCLFCFVLFCLFQSSCTIDFEPSPGEEVAASRGEAVSVADEGVQHVQRSWARF